MPAFNYQPLFPHAEDTTEYWQLTRDFVSVKELDGHDILVVKPEALTMLARRAFHEVSFFLRAKHNEQVAKILKDPEASPNDKFVARALLTNAVVAAAEKLPICQDTGTATIVAKKGQQVFTGGGDEAALARGVYETYTTDNLRYSQTLALTMYEEKNSGTNLPPQIDIYAVDGMAYDFLFVAKGGGSANKTMLYQETRTLLSPENLERYLVEKMKTLGTAACPPYHLAFVIGGTSAEAAVKTVKLASTGYLDDLPTSGNELGQAFRDRELEDKLVKASYKLGFGAQFGGKYFVHDIRVVRLPRHGASCPVAMGVSCSADRNLKGKITKDGLFLEQLDQHPERWLEGSQQVRGRDPGAVPVDLNRPMKELLAELSRHPVKTRLSLTGRLIVARDIAHAKLKERLDQGKGLPDYFKNHAVYYAGPAKTPQGMASGSFGPTTAGRMDAYVDLFQSQGGSMIMIAKGNRSKAVTEACKKHGGFYLGSVGGPAALLAKENIRSMKVIEYPELGMEAVCEIEVVDFPAVILVDDKGNDFFQML
ncbi:MAG: fumarate hydratase [Deltaproteobacteria bacterium]|nr:fumarate hydratase [Deltaproteobacteria bacterium]